MSHSKKPRAAWLFMSPLICALNACNMPAVGGNTPQIPAGASTEVHEGESPSTANLTVAKIFVRMTGFRLKGQGASGEDIDIYNTTPNKIVDFAKIHQDVLGTLAVASFPAGAKLNRIEIDVSSKGIVPVGADNSQLCQASLAANATPGGNPLVLDFADAEPVDADGTTLKAFEIATPAQQALSTSAGGGCELKLNYSVQVKKAS